MILERAITGARHIEVQVLADNDGRTLHLGERDCSIQRRHQKVIEETPSPVVDEELRGQMGQAAIAAAKGVDYVNAGTVEFLLDPDRNYFFLEMNTRLQVEHGVTELVTGRDLVELQLRIAAGEPLPFSQEDVSFSGHALECRIYAEDPASGYLPSPGRLTAFQPPSGEGVRNDVGTYPGDEVSTYYDPMLAKLMTWAEDRTGCLARMRRALADYRIEGVKTNLPLLRSVMAHPVFTAGEATTAFLEEEMDPEALAAGVTEESLLAAFGAVVLGIGAPDDIWDRAGAWRPGGLRRVQLEHAGAAYAITARRKAGSNDAWLLQVQGKKYDVRFLSAGGATVIVEYDGESRASSVERRNDVIEVKSGRQVYAFSLAYPEEHHPHLEGLRGKGLMAPMPGLVLRVLVREGERVHVHQTLVVLEAMKMEHAIEAPHDGIVKKLHCAEGGRVTEGAVLVELEPEPSK